MLALKASVVVISLLTIGPSSKAAPVTVPVCSPAPAASVASFSQMWDNKPGGFYAGDMGFSVRNPIDNTFAFFFGDSAIVEGGQRRFVHSVAMRWTNTGLTRVTGANPDGSFLPDPDGADSQVYWPISAVTDAGKLYVFSDRVSYGDPGNLLSFTTHGRDLAVYNWPACSVPTLSHVATTPSSGRPTSGDAPKIMWGAGALAYNGYVYVYGTYNESDWFGANRTYLARVPSGHLDDQSAWRYWRAGFGYQAVANLATPVNDEHTNSTESTLSIQKVGGLWLMVSKDTILSNNAYLQTSTDPAGPWTRKQIFTCPWGDGTDPQYGAFGHFEIPKTVDGYYLTSVGHNHTGGQLTDLWDNPDWFKVEWHGVKL